MSELIPVRVRDCACPDTPHAEEGDVVYLLPKIGLEGGRAAELDLVAIQELPEDRRSGALMARWGATFVLYGAKGWNWVEEHTDPKGRTSIRPVPFDVNVLLSDYRIGREVAEKANDLYAEAVMAPLVAAARPPKPSPNGSTDGSTSPGRTSTGSPRKRSSRATSAGSRR